MRVLVTHNKPDSLTCLCSLEQRQVFHTEERKAGAEALTSREGVFLHHGPSLLSVSTGRGSLRVPVLSFTIVHQTQTDRHTGEQKDRQTVTMSWSSCDYVSCHDMGVAVSWSSCDYILYL